MIILKKNREHGTLQRAILDIGTNSLRSEKIITFIFGNQIHYLDHLAPLASLLEIPLVVTELEIETLAKKFYPNLQVIYFPPSEVAERVVSHFDVVISCFPKDLFDSIFYIAEELHQKQLINVWCPHGNSDKGHASPFMEGLSKERWAFVYGKKMIDFLKEKGAWNQLEEVFILGNYRYEYFKKHEDFYRSILPFNRTGKTLLYAPTWNDGENLSSYNTVSTFLIDSVPNHWNLIIKPHPHLQVDASSTKENVIFLNHFPPIYPLLEMSDAYLGDMSSVGYDFLTFRRPQFFFNLQKRDPNTDRGLYLTQCGTILDPNKDIFTQIESIDHTPFIKIQDQIYNEVFGKDPTIDAFTKTISQAALH